MMVLNRDSTCYKYMTYCSINRTKLVPSGKSNNMICPVCGQEYEHPDPQFKTAEERQKYIDRVYGTHWGI